MRIRGLVKRSLDKLKLTEFHSSAATSRSSLLSRRTQHPRSCRRNRSTRRHAALCPGSYQGSPSCLESRNGRYITAESAIRIQWASVTESARGRRQSSGRRPSKRRDLQHLAARLPRVGGNFSITLDFSMDSFAATVTGHDRMDSRSCCVRLRYDPDLCSPALPQSR